VLLKVSPSILGVVLDLQATAETNCLFQDASNKPSFIPLTHADRNKLFFMFQDTNDLSCATVLLKLPKNVSRFDGMYFGGNMLHLSSAQNTYVLKMGTERFSETSKNFCQCVRHHMLLEANQLTFITTSSTANSKFITISLLILVWHLGGV